MEEKDEQDDLFACCDPCYTGCCDACNFLCCDPDYTAMSCINETK